MERIYTIKLDNGASYQVRGADELELQRQDICIIRKDFYQDWGTITRLCNELEPGKGAEIPLIAHKATPEELQTIEDNRAKERGALRSAQDMVQHLGLPMKLLNAHYSLDLKFLAIQFTADGRVDFRELVKELSRTLNTRIELRQIGVRDESAIHGGISVCGQVLCCCRFLKEFNSINVRMAKDQDLSLTPATISGVCGRLKCCLKYEHEGYQELEKTMPRRGEWCETPSGRGRICDRNLLTQEVLVQLENGNQIRCSREEIEIVPMERRPQNANGDNNRGRNNDNRGDRNDRGNRNNDNRGDRNNDGNRNDGNRNDGNRNDGNRNDGNRNNDNRGDRNNGGNRNNNNRRKNDNRDNRDNRGNRDNRNRDGHATPAPAAPERPAASPEEPKAE